MNQRKSPRPQRAAIAGILILAAAGAALFWLRTKRSERPPVVAAAAATFTDVTQSAGIDFTHRNGAYGKKLFPEMMGSGAAWLDGDGDGFLDLLLLNSPTLSGDPKPQPGTNRYYRNRGDGTFEDRTQSSGLAGGGYAMGAAVGDWDNDGHPDLFVSHLGYSRLYRNRGNGTFEDASSRSKVGHDGYGSSAAFLDYDRDGDLDLFVCHYVDLPRPMDKIACRNPRGRLQYCDVHLYDGLPSRLYRNNGNGSFTDVSRASGIGGRRGRGLAVVVGDVDDDGDPDIIVANDENPNHLWRNNGNGTFTEAAAEAGIAYDQRGETIAGMGLDLGDVDRDGQPDLYESGFQSEPNVFFRREVPGFFLDRTNDTGIGELTRNYLSFGLAYLDYDLDGWLDLFVANGHVIDDVTEFNPSIPYEQTPTLFHNVGKGRFVDAAQVLGPYGKQRWVGRGVATADFDNDGDVDLLVTHNHQRAVLLRNDTVRAHHWITLRCLTSDRKREAIGARVTVTAGGVRYVREARAALSYLSSCDARVNIGLGAAAGIESVEIQWPDGRVETIPPPAVDRIVTVVQGAGRAE